MLVTVTEADRAIARRAIKHVFGLAADGPPTEGSFCSWHLSTTCPCAFNGWGNSVWSYEEEAARCAALGRAMKA